MSNFTKSHLTHKIFIILPVFSLFLWNLTFLFSVSDRKFSLVLLQNFFVFNLLPGFFHYYSYRCFTTVAKKNRMKKEWRKNKIKVDTDTMLLQMTNYIFWALEKCKKNAVFFKLFWYKVFVHWKLKFLNFLVDSVLKFSPGFTRFTP